MSWWSWLLIGVLGLVVRFSPLLADLHQRTLLKWHRLLLPMPNVSTMSPNTPVHHVPGPYNQVRSDDGILRLAA